MAHQHIEEEEEEPVNTWPVNFAKKETRAHRLEEEADPFLSRPAPA